MVFIFESGMDSCTDIELSKINHMSQEELSEKENVPPPNSYGEAILLQAAKMPQHLRLLHLKNPHHET